MTDLTVSNTARIIPKVLIVDDDKFFLEFYRAELSQYDFDVDFAVDGEEALKKARDIKPNIILLDVILPKKDGFQVLAALKKDELTKDIPVIINSSLGDKSDIDKLIALGAVAAFNKLTQLPKDTAIFIKESLLKGFPTISKKATSIGTHDTKLSSDQVNLLFKQSLLAIEKSLEKLFKKKAELEDMNAEMISYAKFQEHIRELSKMAGTLFIYSTIDATVPGLAILSMRRNTTLSLIKLIEQGMAGKDMGLGLSDQVIEEFVNIILNAFLTKLSGSIQGRFLLAPAVISNPASIQSLLNKINMSENNLVVLLEQAYMVKDLDLNFSLFVIFGSELFENINTKK